MIQAAYPRPRPLTINVSRHGMVDTYESGYGYTNTST